MVLFQQILHKLWPCNLGGGVGLEESRASLLGESHHLNPCQTHQTHCWPRLGALEVHLGPLRLGARSRVSGMGTELLDFQSMPGLRFVPVWPSQRTASVNGRSLGCLSHQALGFL